MSTIKLKNGFTLIELIIVVALIIMFSALTLPVGFNFYQKSTLKDQAKTLENSLRMAQAMAMSGRGESNAGVIIEEGQYTVFEGDSYEDRPANITIPFPIALSATGPTEVVFEKITGLPIIPAITEEELITITLKFGANSQEININSQGKIERNEESE
jgi:prepilin-type N-terminal cleavage/methylation domain-containing protein